MTLVSLEKIERRFGEHVVLDGASMRVEDRDRIGIIGDNGVGKTTFIRVLAGYDEPDGGARNVRKGARIGFAAQIPEFTPDTTIEAFVMRGDGEFQELSRQVAELEAQLATAPHDATLLQRYGALQGAFEAGGGYDREHMCKRVLSGLGFSEKDRQKDVNVLSGGEGSRVVLASLMLQPVDLLILDEPTNHLDLPGIEFVESFVNRHPGAVVAVSHDRRFLDAVATSIVEVAGGIAASYKGNYSAFIQQTDQNLLSTSRAFKDQQEFVKKEMAFIRKHMGSRLTAQAKGRLKRLKRLQLIQLPKTAKGSMQLKFVGGRGQSGQSILEVKGLGAKLPNSEWLFEDLSFRLYHGETLGLLGRNGAGKTTLLRMLCEMAPIHRGEIQRAHKVRPGVFTQEMSDLPTQGTVFGALQALAPQATNKELRDHLALFMFSGDEVEAEITGLSGGEKRRVCLARLMWGEFDYLCLDEPTNHLDITAREGLEEAVRAYPGATLVISHDRTFLEAVTDRVLYLDDQGLRVFERGMEQCIAALREDRLQRKADRRDAEAKNPAPPPPVANSSDRPEKIRNPMMFAKLETEIVELEEALESLKAEMEQPENYTNHENLLKLQTQETETQAKLAEAYERWENWETR